MVGALGAAGAAAAGLAFSPAVAEASSSNLYVVVDAAGGGDYTSIEAAVAAVPAESTIFVKSGTYLVNDGPMDPAPGVRIIGEGYGSHIRLADGKNFFVFKMSRDRVTLESLRIDGNGMNQAYASSDVVAFVNKSQGGGITNCWVHDAAGYNIVVWSGCANITIANNKSYNAREEGIELHGASYCSIVGNLVWNVGASGIYLWNADGDCGFNTVVGNVVSNCVGINIYLSDGAHDNTITGNVSRGSQNHGIQATKNSHDNVIAGNTAVGNALDGIVINLCGPNTVMGNTSRANTMNGIRIDRAPDCVVSGNVVRENGRTGIWANVANGAAITGNVASLNGRNGIELSTTSAETTRGLICTGNTARANGRGSDNSRRSGIMIYGPCLNSIIASNRCYDDQPSPTQLYGINVNDSGPDPLQLGPNQLAGNVLTGLYVPSSSTARIDSPPVRKLKATVDTTQVAVPHGLPYIPRSMAITMTSAGSIWKSASPDATNVYLKADAAGRTAEILVG
jgi:parallel beta-helix repeat protein